jgi:hypothetical protein
MMMNKLIYMHPAEKNISNHLETIKDMLFIMWNKKPILQPILGVGNMRYVSHEKAIVG